MDDEKRALLAKKRYVLVLVHTDMKEKIREKNIFFLTLLLLFFVEWNGMYT